MGPLDRVSVTDEPWGEPPEELYTLTKSGSECPNEPAYVELSFERGVPVAINGVAMPLVDLIASLTTIAGAHGVGRLDLVESRPDGRFRRSTRRQPRSFCTPRTAS